MVSLITDKLSQQTLQDVDKQPLLAEVLEPLLQLQLGAYLGSTLAPAPPL